jgi:uncharacterized membrane protein
MKMKKSTSLIFLTILILLAGMVNAQVLVNVSVDKPELSTNEVAYLTIQIRNETGTDFENYLLRLESGENLAFLESQDNYLLQEIDLIRSGMSREIKVRFKAVDTSEETGELFVYYGDEHEFVSGTFVKTTQLPVGVSSRAVKQSTKQGERVQVTFEMHNYSGDVLQNVGVSVLAPPNFTVITPEVILPVMLDGNRFVRTFEVLAPLEAEGEKNIILSYGFFDKTGAHYFEENFVVSFEKENNVLLAGIGIIILIVAVLIYVSKSKKPTEKAGTNVQGTADKE